MVAHAQNKIIIDLMLTPATGSPTSCTATPPCPCCDALQTYFHATSCWRNLHTLVGLHSSHHSRPYSVIAITSITFAPTYGGRAQQEDEGRPRPWTDCAQSSIVRVQGNLPLARGGKQQEIISETDKAGTLPLGEESDSLLIKDRARLPSLNKS